MTAALFAAVRVVVAVGICAALLLVALGAGLLVGLRSVHGPSVLADEPPEEDDAA